MALRRRSLWASGIIGAAALIFAVPFSSAAGPAPAANEELPPFAVEDFAYPGADRVLETRGIELKRGDGHIVLTDCDLNAPQIRVLTVADSGAGREGTYCFRATAAKGFLTLSLPRVFALEAADRPISADLTADGETTTVDVPKGGFESVGEGTPGGARSVLVELRVTG
ncbi:hypothetical protein [Streptomyces sp. PTY087I2]|uniref:hypothetical protein n=1 Tax=Streptomyces sp. PTY087I2 TaxID=1819298 RepID=UPI0008289140|nr:hypothetical protein [Streptomyces sp. PTY087I2]OCC09937.1 hypothetical protein A3Q37_04527 [Streptomyces sp. PTY087I2]